MLINNLLGLFPFLDTWCSQIHYFHSWVGSSFLISFVWVHRWCLLFKSSLVHQSSCEAALDSAQTRSTRFSVSCSVQKAECVSGLMQTCCTLHTERLCACTCGRLCLSKHLLTSAPPLLKRMANIQEISAVIYGFITEACRTNTWLVRISTKNQTL